MRESIEHLNKKLQEIRNAIAGIRGRIDKYEKSIVSENKLLEDSLIREKSVKLAVDMLEGKE